MQIDRKHPMLLKNIILILFIINEYRFVQIQKYKYIWANLSFLMRSLPCNLCSQIRFRVRSSSAGPTEKLFLLILNFEFLNIIKIKLFISKL